MVRTNPGVYSFYTMLSAGVPQVLLPAWTDCYDFANRVELLGIGRWGNKEAKPRWRQDELAEALQEVVSGTESMQKLKTSKQVASRHPKWEGRQKAAQEILDYLASED
ncbi:uncharacterized protein FTOL_02007 [Fusarium torulosum]|uniref:Uncharacterized protein n=1 Tax=Fusarium torulosum TaxID=33205 RepID=A0AAE8M161_9HYPO|nr:uncharacterized protein FTOL_02007 [Fusarium torulosum]